MRMHRVRRMDLLVGLLGVFLVIGQDACSREAKGSPRESANSTDKEPGASSGYGQWGPMGPGAMDGYGRWGMMGQGMMGSYGRGGMMSPGMMGSHGRWGMMGPGVMGGYGRGGMMGPGMMGGYGMGPDMMRGYGMGPIWNLVLSKDQRAKIDKIADALRQKHWAIMGQVMQDEVKLRDLYAAAQPDPKQVGKAYAAIAKLRQEMVEAHVKANNDAEAVLTKDQRAQLARWEQ